jgi:hypothetical protein
MKVKWIAIGALAIVILFVGAFTGTLHYYTGLLADRDSEIASLNTQIANQNKEIADLNSQIAQEPNFTSPRIMTQLGVTEIGGSSPYAYGTYWRLFIQGSAVNVGNTTAYNAGLKVIAYSGTGQLEINMTVPLVNGYNYGTDAAIVSSIEYDIGPTQLGNLTAGQYAIIDLDIYHEGVVTNWTVTPVWTDTP